MCEFRNLDILYFVLLAIIKGIILDLIYILDYCNIINTRVSYIKYAFGFYYFNLQYKLRNNYVLYLFLYIII